ncbi:MAG: nucleotidyltransferase substrate binding protein [Cytophagaceae bacterium]|nr:nucleotidyltransferase substrate binding protein [Cytophagaceae bacterium]
MEDVRWVQRFSNFKKAFAQLEKAVEQPEYTDLEKEGVVQRFEYTYELAWNTLRDYLDYQGYQDVKGARDAIQLAFRTALIEDGEAWMQMFKSRNLTSHTYNRETAEAILKAIKESYFFLLNALIIKLESEQGQQESN